MGTILSILVIGYILIFPIYTIQRLYRAEDRLDEMMERLDALGIKIEEKNKE